jgi:hypothetical protein
MRSQLSGLNKERPPRQIERPPILANAASQPRVPRGGTIDRMVAKRSSKSSALVGVAVVGLAAAGVAVGAMAIGALAIGALGIGRLGMGSGRIEELSIGKLTVDELVVKRRSESSQ